MTWTMLGNDDGVDSPALAPFAAALGMSSEVRVCVPDSERSWVGKGITRFHDITIEQRLAAGQAGAETWTCSGTPADAAQVGMHTIWPTRPSLVVSGINIGSNVGAGFLLSSGTIGVALEAWISGIPAIAVSTRSTHMDWGTWARHATSPEGRAGWDRLAGVAAQIVADVVATGLHLAADVVSINLPWEAGLDTPRRVTDVARVGYGALFSQPDDDPARRRFTFNGDLLPMDDSTDHDVDVLERGEVSITPLRAPSALHVTDEMRQRVERG